MKTKLTAQSAEIYAHRDLKMTVSEQELNIRILERDSAKMKKKFENTIQEIRSKYEECRKNLRSSDDELLKHKQLCEKQDEDLEDAREKLEQLQEDLSEHKDAARKMRQEQRMHLKAVQDDLKTEKGENLELNKSLHDRNERIDALEEQLRKTQKDFALQK